MPKKKKRWQLATWLPKKKKGATLLATLLPKKKGQRYCLREGKKKKLEENMGIFVNQEKIHPPSVFSPF